MYACSPPRSFRVAHRCRSSISVTYVAFAYRNLTKWLLFCARPGTCLLSSRAVAPAPLVIVHQRPPATPFRLIHLVITLSTLLVPEQI